MSPTLRPPGLRGAAHGLVREQLGVAGQFLLRERPVRERGELHPRPSRQVQLRAVVGELADPQDVLLPLGYADGAARVEQVEGVRALQAVVVRRKRKVPLDEAAALALVLVEEAQEPVGIARVEAVLALLPLVLPEGVAVGEPAAVRVRAEDEVVDVVDALQVHGDALEPVGELRGHRPALVSPGLLEVGELRHLHPVAPDFPAEPPGPQRGRLPVVFDEAQIVVVGGDADRAQRAEVLLLDVLGAGLEDHLVLVVLVEAVGILAEAAVRGPARGLDVGDVPGLGPEHAQEGRRIHRPRAHLQVVPLHQRAAAVGPIGLQGEEEALEILGSARVRHRARERRRSAAIAQARGQSSVAGFRMVATGTFQATEARSAGLFLLVHRRRQKRDVVRRRRLFLLRLRAHVVEHRLVLIEQRLHLLHERHARPLQLLDLADQLHPSRLRIRDDLLRLQLGAGDDVFHLLAGVDLHLLCHLLGGGQRLLEELLAVLEFVDPGLAAAQLLVLAVELARQLLQLGGDEVEPGAHLALVESPERDLAEGLLLQVEGSELHGSEDTPAVKVPVRSGALGETAAKTPPRWEAFTWYMASSARRIRFSGSRASSGNAATPRLAVSFTGPQGLSPRTACWAISAPVRRAAATAWSLRVSGIRAANSSPP